MPLLQNIVWDGPWAAFAWPVKDQNGFHHISVIVVRNRGEKSPSVLENHTILKLIDYARPSNTLLFLGSGKSHQHKTNVVREKNIRQRCCLYNLIHSCFKKFNSNYMIS